MRDLDQLEERDPQERGRRTGMAIMFGIMSVAVVFGLGSMMSNAASPQTAAKADPLDQLYPAMDTARATKLNAASDPKPVAAAPTPVDATELTFQRELSEEEDRPEVIEALAAAAREEERLAPQPEAAEPPKPPERAAPPQPSAAAAVAASADAFEDDEADVDVPHTRVTRVPSAALKAAAKELPPKASPAKDAAAKAASKESALKEAASKALAAKQGASKTPPVKEPPHNNRPAGLVASIASQKLEKAARHDHLVAAALPGKTEPPKARAGADGEFTLQVISYDSLATAQAFANDLRAKGHEAFVAAGDVEGRGRYYRVRIGPFKTKPQAEAYRRSFEEQEAMNTIVVKRPDR